MSSPISLVFCGTSDFAVPILQALAKNPAFHIQMVITQPDRPVGRKQVLTAPAVKQAALELGLEVFQPEKLNKETELFLQHPRPDYLVVVAYGQILSQAVLDWPMRMPINVHGSLLPRWRGASPIHHAILAGDTQTGVTVQKMAKQLDAGAILAQETIDIEPRETFVSLYAKLSALGAQLLVRTLLDLPEPREQDESAATFCKTFTKEDGHVDLGTKTAEEIDRAVRALNPWPSVTVTIDNQPLKLLETALEAVQGSTPLPCANGSTVHAVSVQPAGKKPMSGADWARGKH